MHRVRGSKASIFLQMTQNKTLIDSFKTSVYYDDIQDRLHLVSSIPDILEEERKASKIMLYKYNKPHWTTIEGDYLLKFVHEGNVGYLFLVERDKGELFCINSIINDDRQFEGNDKPINYYKKEFVSCDNYN